MAGFLNRHAAIPEIGVDDYEDGDDDATEASQRSILAPLTSSTSGGGITRMEGWLNHISSSYKNNTNTSNNSPLPTTSSSNAPQTATSTPSSSSTTSKLSKTVTKKTMTKRPRYFVLRGSTLSYYARRHDVKAKGTFVLTKGCTVGPVVFGSLEDIPNSTTTITDANAGNNNKSKKKTRQYYCVQLIWPTNNKPSRDEQVIAQVKAQVAAESENEALQQQKLHQLQQLELQEMSPLVVGNGSVGEAAQDIGSKSPMPWPKQLIRRVKSESTGSPRQSYSHAKHYFQEKSLQFVPDGDDYHECDHNDSNGQDREQLCPTLLFPAAATNNSAAGGSSGFQSPVMSKTAATTLSGKNSHHRRDTSEMPAAAAAAQQHELNTIHPSLSHDHDFGPHKHYKTLIEKQTRDQQKSAEQLQKVMHLLSQEASHQKTRKRVIQGTKVAAVSTAAVTAGILTAGVGLAAGLVFVGVTAAAGGSGAVVGSRVFDKARGKYFQHQSQKSFHLIIGAATYDEAMRWKKAMEYVIKELVEESHEEAGEMGDEWNIKKVLSGSEHQIGGDAVAGTDVAFNPSNGIKRGIINEVNENAMHLDTAPTWVPIQGGGMALWGILGALGGGGGSLRIYREELSGGSSSNPYSSYSAPWLFSQPPNSPFPTIPRFRSDVGLAGHPFPRSRRV